MDLLDYATTKKYRCLVCEIPERREIETAWSRGVRETVIISWLKEVKAFDGTLTRNSIRGHFENHHS